MSKKLTTEEFIERAKAVHGDKYDYSLVEYKANHDKVKIICKNCGKVFEQTPSKHIRGQGCPNRCYIDYKKLNFIQFVNKMNKIHNYKYTYDENSFDERLNNNYKIKIHCKNCNKDFYQDLGHHSSGEGCPYCMHTRSKITRKKIYGDENYNNRPKMLNTCLKRYGKYYVQTEEFKEKYKQTCLEKYKKEFVTQTKNHKEKVFNSRKKHGTINTSKYEKEIKVFLLKKFPNAKYQYKSELYPFHCDFYIPELDLYIEYQGYEGHGKEPFDENNQDHLNIIKSWKENAEKKEKETGKKSKYSRYIDIWTISDPLKRKTAKDNSLNWIEFFDMKQFLKWYNNL